jgi:serine/threonine protein kinase
MYYRGKEGKEGDGEGEGEGEGGGGENWTLKLIDFGLARAPSAGASSVDGVSTTTDVTIMSTQTQSVAGTLLYAPPEQLEEDKPLDFRSDIFAVGVTLYQLGCGCFPHQRDGSGSLPLTAAAVLLQLKDWQLYPPTPLDQVLQLRMAAGNFAEAGGIIDAGFARAVTKAIAFEPQQRFQSAAEMLQLVEELRVLVVVISAPGRSLAGEDVMGFVERACKVRSDMLFGYDWAGATSADPRDSEVVWSRAESVRQSYWFKGYRESVKAEIKVLCQQHPRSRLRLVCITGGPISQLEVREIKMSLTEEAAHDLKARSIELRVEVVEMGFERFKALAGPCF